jgi:hypothetical protein
MSALEGGKSFMVIEVMELALILLAAVAVVVAVVELVKTLFIFKATTISDRGHLPKF